MKFNQQAKPFRRALPLLLAATCSTDLEDTPLDQHHVKASYLFNLLRFIEWPADACPADGTLSLTICGAASLDAYYALDGERVGDRTVSVQRMKQKDLAAGRVNLCQVLVISGDVPIMSTPMARGLLTVGESDAFTACGGIINLLLIRGRVRFQLNEEVAQACGFALSPRLLSLQMR